VRLRLDRIIGMRVVALVAIIAAGLLLALASTASVAGEIRSYAAVQDDGSLIVRGQHIRLFGVFIPQGGWFCQRRISPARCRSSVAALALDFRIRGFVRCEAVEENADGSLAAFCSVGSTRLGDSEDLGAYLISRGHAFAAPWAPYEYFILQELAKVNRRGLWGFGAWY
jgi:endonuclease YncB( thermonuclease family)